MNHATKMMIVRGLHATFDEARREAIDDSEVEYLCLAGRSVLAEVIDTGSVRPSMTVCIQHIALALMQFDLESRYADSIHAAAAELYDAVRTDGNGPVA